MADVFLDSLRNLKVGDTVHVSGHSKPSVITDIYNGRILLHDTTRQFDIESGVSISNLAFELKDIIYMIYKDDYQLVRPGYTNKGR